MDISRDWQGCFPGCHRNLIQSSKSQLDFGLHNVSTKSPTLNAYRQLQNEQPRQIDKLLQYFISQAGKLRYTCTALGPKQTFQFFLKTSKKSDFSVVTLVCGYQVFPLRQLEVFCAVHGQLVHLFMSVP